MTIKEDALNELKNLFEYEKVDVMKQLIRKKNELMHMSERLDKDIARIEEMDGWNPLWEQELKNMIWWKE